MPVNLISLNGTSSYIDYNELDNSLKLFLGNHCQEATVYIYNNFPVPVSSDLRIDILILISLHDINGNYSRHLNKEQKFDYFRNLIVPITINNSFINSKIVTHGNFLEIDDFEYDVRDELNSLKFGLLNFLESKCDFERNKLIIEPIELILNNQQSLIFGNKMIVNNFVADHFFNLLKRNPYHFFQSYQPWKGNNNYEKFKDDASKINEIISEYTQFGYLTKRKVERVGKQLVDKSAMYDAIGKQPTLISGKAGTGKTAHLLHLLIRCLTNNRNVTFLTYNHLLTKDITTQVRLIESKLHDKWIHEGKDISTFANTTVETLMGFMYRFSKSLGVLHLMTEKRVIELKEVLDKSLKQLNDELPGLLNQYAQKIFGMNVNWNAAIEAIQNSKMNVSVKQYGIFLVKFLRKNNKSLTIDLTQSIEEFRKYKVLQLEEMTYKNVFLKDYKGCLTNTLNMIRNPKEFYEMFDVKNKFDLLDVLMNLSGRKQDEYLMNKLISLELLESRMKNVIKGRTTKERILMIDEGQDCYSLEREIFYEIFIPERVVVSFGGKEQLIRFSEICEWEIFRNKRIDIKKIGSGNKSYRVKKHILDFCNFIATKNKIDFNLQSYSEQDPGQLIFDFNPINPDLLGKSFSSLLEKGAVNGCSPLESLLILDINTPKIMNDKEQDGGTKNSKHYPVTNMMESVVNEYDVLEEQLIAEYNEFNYLKKLSTFSEYWVGAVADKQKAGFPHPNEVRVINYESCRGLEAWCVMCLNIDKFYNVQLQSDEGEKYLLHEDIFLKKEERAAMYAITWVLMAATRGIDTLYFQMSDSNNEFVDLCKEYVALNKDKCIVVSA